MLRARSGISVVRRVSLGVIALALLASGLVLAPAAQATPIVKCNNGGLLQPALDSASPGATILITGTCRGQFSTSNEVTLKGDPTATLDGMDAGTVFNEGGSSPLHLKNLTVTGGSATCCGAGVYATGDLSLDHVKLVGNVASGYEGINAFGGGAQVFGNLKVTDSTIANNRADTYGNDATSTVFGAGGGVWVGGNLTITGSVVSGNAATVSNYTAAGQPEAKGGGITVEGKLTLTDTKLTGNRVGVIGNGDGTHSPLALGSAVYSDSNIASTITGALISGNTTGGIPTSTFAPVTGGPIWFNNSTSVLTISRSTISGNILTAGNSGAGGVIAPNLATTLTVQNSVVKNNLAIASGPGATMEGSEFLATTLTLSGTTVTGNKATARSGPGSGNATNLAVLLASTITVTKSTVSGNSLTALTDTGTAVNIGGAIDSGTVTLNQSTVDGNTLTTKATGASGAATSVGAGVVSNSLTSKASTISRNVANATANASNGTAIVGGAGVDSSTVALTNSTVALNSGKASTSSSTGTSTSQGGGIAIGNSSASTLVDTTVVGNSIKGAGNTLTVQGGGIWAGNMTSLQDTILAKNTGPSNANGPDCFSGLVSAHYNVIGNSSGCAFVSGTGDKLNKDPKLGALANYGGPTQTMLPVSTSPAVDVIPNTHAACPQKKDQRGTTRPQGGKCDIGADERTAKDPNPKVVFRSAAAASGGRGTAVSRSAAVSARNAAFRRALALRAFAFAELARVRRDAGGQRAAALRAARLMAAFNR